MDAALNILVIDDDAAIRELLSEILLEAEHQVVAVGSAEEALEALPFWSFQVAFLDHGLPGMDGLVLGEYLRRNNPDMLIALVTGADDKKLHKRSREASIVHVQKPFDVGRILGLVDEYRDGARERHEQRLEKSSESFEPSISAYAEELGEVFAMQKVPDRVQERLIEVLKRTFNDLRSVGRYTERDRVIALAGLITARVLGVELPNVGDRSMYEEYDELMRQHGRQTAFHPSPPPSSRTNR